MARRADDLPSPVVVLNPEEDCSPAAFRSLVDELSTVPEPQIESLDAVAVLAVLPIDAVGWVPEHFYVEVAGVVRHHAVVARTLTEDAVATMLDRLDRWYLRRVQPAPLIASAWRFRHNMTMADALYVALAAELAGALLTEDHRLANAPGFPVNVRALTVDRS